MVIPVLQAKARTPCRTPRRPTSRETFTKPQGLRRSGGGLGRDAEKMPRFSPGPAQFPWHKAATRGFEMYSLLSLLTGAVLVGLVYGLSFLPTATLARPDDELGLGVTEDGTGADDSDSGDTSGPSEA
jgi:hypothetical protein